MLLQKDVGESDGLSNKNGQEVWMASQRVVDKSWKCSGKGKSEATRRFRFKGECGSLWD